MEGKCPQCGAPLDGERCGYCGYRAPHKAGKKKKREESRTADAREAQTPQPETEPVFHDDVFKDAPGEGILYGISRKKWSTTLLLCVFLGCFGAHRFYTKKMYTGLLYLCTLGLFGVGWVVDILLILTDMFRDGYDLTLRR